MAVTARRYGDFAGFGEEGNSEYGVCHAVVAIGFVETEVYILVGWGDGYGVKYAAIGIFRIDAVPVYYLVFFDG